MKSAESGYVMKVLLVDDHASIRTRLREVLGLRPDFEVVGEGANGLEAVEGVAAHDPDVVLMDVNMPVMSGVEATKLIREAHPLVKVLALTAYGDMSHVSAMVKAGASGYLIKGGPPHELLESLEAVATGRGAVDREVAGELLKNMAELYHREQDRVEALTELDRMKSEFVSVVSHELRTPLTSMKAGVRTLSQNWDSIDERMKQDFLEVINRQCDKLDGLVHQILTVAGIQTGGLGVDVTRFALHEAVAAATVSSGETVDGRVSLELDEVEAFGDPVRITQIVAALIDNALTFTDGAVVVRVHHEGGPRVDVLDEGPGMDQAIVERVLSQPFVQRDSSDTRRSGGLGLSLYIAARVLEAAEGRLEVDTGEDRGSRFSVVLKPAPEPEPEPEPEPDAASVNDGRR
ncbi:MAG: response regulator [Actinomycetota bacterium]|nr:response regulator [Actinomycetota bacterium]